jgi:TetR/AcrR family transcriptional repressor of nem operon
MGRAPTNTRQKLIETATELLWRNSYGSVSVDDICRSAGVQKGSFYHYFRSKAGLALATLEECHNEAMPLFEEIFSPAHPPITRLEKLAELKISKQKEIKELYGQVCGCPFAALGSELAGQEEDVRIKIENICVRHLSFLEDTLNDMIGEGQLSEETDTHAKAEEIFSYILGQLTFARIQNSIEPLEKHLKSGIFNLIGISRPSANPSEKSKDERALS